MVEKDGQTNSTVNTTLPVPAKVNELPERVDVAIPDVVVTEKEAMEAFARLGMTTLQPRTLSDLDSLGIHIKGAGVFRNQRGQAVLNQHRLQVAMHAALTVIQNICTTKKNPSAGSLSKLFTSLAAMSGKLTESQRLMIEMETLANPGAPPVDDSPPTTNSFPVGRPVVPQKAQTTIFARDVHLHEGKPAETDPK